MQFFPSGLPLAGLAPKGADCRINEVIGPSDDSSLLIDSATHAAHAGWAIEVVLHIVFVCPDELDRRGDVTRDLSGFGLEVVLDAPAEASTHEGGVHGDPDSE